MPLNRNFSVKRCVAVHCNNWSDPEKGISVHSFPQAMWKEPAMDNQHGREVVLRRRAGRRAPDSSSEHFTSDCFDLQSTVMRSPSGYKQKLVHEKISLNIQTPKKVQVCAVHEHPSARRSASVIYVAPGP